MLFDPSYCADELQRPYVQKGAAWLDETNSGWVRKIVPSALNLRSRDMCICGQVFGSYMSRPDTVFAGQLYGFTVHGSVEEVFAGPCPCGTVGCGNMLSLERQHLLWASLDRLWLDEVYWRLG